ncbi:protein kinase [Cryptosporidium ubiquitum]|uniref:non-specific serine/threonine protein kinase n=1 Tax=Cryptosporidium ubiquitum TaxID=857276 RepID=A0A1J4MMK8_9CRYT|nr:protein kinase [Cryptosporidium ubiquitum]OII75481.1 protein kinase [Cryptosporidium ubiquitum]
MKGFSKEEVQKPFTNRQVIDIKSRSDNGGRFYRNNAEIGYESGIWSKFVGLMKNSLNISILNKSSNQLNKLTDNMNSKNHLKEIIMKKSIEKFTDKQTKVGGGLREQKELNIGLKSKVEKSSVSPKSTKISPSLSPLVSFPYSTSSPSSSCSPCSFSSPSSLNENIGISFAEQILNYNSNEYSKVISGQAPVTPTTLDGSSTTTSPAFTNLHFPSPSNNNGSTKYETPNYREIDSSEKSVSSNLKDEYFSNKKNHAVDFSADDNHLNYIMERINQGVLTDFNDKSIAKLDIPLINHYNSHDLIPEASSYFDGNNKRLSNNKGNLLGRGLTSLTKHSSSVSYSPSSLISGKNDKVCYTWKEAKHLISKLKSSSKLYKFNGVPFSDWVHEKIPTLGASPTSCRVQEMFKSRIYFEKDNNEIYVTLFIKKVPRNIWSKQWEMHEIWDGDYVTDGEDFVMEAAALAFLQNHSVGIAPKLYAILEHCEKIDHKENKISYKNISNKSPCDYLLSKDTTHIILVSEYYGEDLLDYLDKCEKKNRNLTDKEKKDLQYKLVLALNNLHSKGLCHLDFTPENILIGSNGINICDFAKSTPIITKNPRHTHYSRKSPKNHLSENFNSNNASFNFINPPPEAYYEFESCEPTVGKGAYMPPECWKIFWKLEENKIQFPLEELMDVDTYNQRNNYPYLSEFSKIHNKSPIKCQDRSMFYFNARIADIYMLGIIMFWIWSDGGIWKYSDTRQDHRYQNLVFSDINFDVFRECRNWNKQLKSLLKKMLEPDPKKRITMSEILSDPWWRCPLDS